MVTALLAPAMTERITEQLAPYVLSLHSECFGHFPTCFVVASYLFEMLSEDLSAHLPAMLRAGIEGSFGSATALMSMPL